MALIMRNGEFSYFNPDKMLPAEWGIVLSGDPSVTDGRSVYICFAAGSVKRMATYEDMVQQFENMAEDTIILLTEGVNVAAASAEAAASYANRAGENAYAQSQAAEVAVNTAESFIEMLEQKIQAGELTGPQGPAGEKGNDAAVVEAGGQYALQIEADGHLYLLHEDHEVTPELALDENGHLILTIGE